MRDLLDFPTPWFSPVASDVVVYADWPSTVNHNVLLPFRIGIRKKHPGLTKSRPHDRTTAQRPHSLGDRAGRPHALRICLITTAHRLLALINLLCGIVRPHIATAQQMMYAFHGPFIYYNRICIGVKIKNTQIKTQMYQLMLALFGRLIY